MIRRIHATIFHPALVGWIFFLWLTLPGVGRAQQRPVADATPVSAIRPSAQPGTMIVLSVKVQNMTSAPRTFRTRAVVPANWKAMVAATPFTLAPNTDDVRLIPVRVPGDARSQIYPVHVVIQQDKDTTTVASCSFDVRVTPVVGLDLQPLSIPRYVVEGRSIRFSVGITNTGNVPMNIFLEGKSSHGTLVKFDSSRVTLAPRQSAIVGVRTASAQDFGNQTNQVITVKAIPSINRSAAQTATVVVAVVPRHGEVEAPSVLFPVQATLRATGDRDRRGLQGEVAGYGAISEEGTERVEFLFRTPGQQGRTDLGLQDEYKVRYMDQHLDVFLGDWSYNLSPLTDLGRYAFGAGARYHTDRWSLTGYANKNRFPGMQQKQVGGTLTVSLARRHDVTLSLLNRTDSTTSTIGSLRYQSLLMPWASVDAEVARTISSGAQDLGAALRLSGNGRWGNYQGQFLSASPKFRGYYRDIQVASLSGVMSMPMNLHMEFDARSQKRNLDIDTTMPYAPSNRQFQAGIGYSNLFVLSYRVMREEDNVSISKASKEDDMAQVRGFYALSGFSVNGLLETGISRDLLVRQSSPYRRVSASASMMVLPQTTISAGVEQQDDRDMFSRTEQRRRTVNASLQSAFLQTTRAYLNVFLGQTLKPTAQTFTLLDAMIEHVFPFQHRVQFRTRYSGAPSIGSRMSWLLEYGIPLEVPVTNITNVGRLTGRITDERGKGIANVLVSVEGHATVTESDGSFAFTPLTPGRYFLILDRASIDLARIPSVAMPLEVEVTGGQERNVPISVIRSASINGSVSFFTMEQRVSGDSTRNELVPDQLPQPGAVQVEISNGIEVQRHLTDNIGAFSFTDLRPGTWTVTFYGTGLGENQVLEQDQITIDLVAGKKEDLMVRVLPRRRSLRILKSGPVLMTESTKDTAPKSSLVPPAPVTHEACITMPIPGGKGFRIQESSWASESVARAQAARIKANLGLTAVAERVVVGFAIRYRVYVGPFATETDAATACKALKALEAGSNQR